MIYMKVFSTIEEKVSLDDEVISKIRNHYNLNDIDNGLFYVYGEGVGNEIDEAINKWLLENNEDDELAENEVVLILFQEKKE